MPEPLEERRDESAAELIDRIEQHSQEIASAQFERPAAGRWRIIVLAVGIVSSSAS